MNTFSLILAFTFGAIVGSFLNVVSLRFNTGKGIGGRSMCLSCGKTLTWIELVPIFSFIFQRGACWKCRSKISWQYPLVELATGLLFVLIFVKFAGVTGPSALLTLIQIFLACILVVISVYDVKHKIIPDQFVWTFNLVALGSLFLGGSSWWHVPTAWQLLAGPAIALPFALIWLFSKGRWMGLGDAKLLLGLGWLVGMSRAINGTILAFWIAAAISLVWLYVVHKRFRPRTEIPFGPYLILGMYLVLLFNVQVVDLAIIKSLVIQYLQP